MAAVRHFQVHCLTACHLLSSDFRRPTRRRHKTLSFTHFTFSLHSHFSIYYMWRVCVLFELLGVGRLQYSSSAPESDSLFIYIPISILTRNQSLHYSTTIRRRFDLFSSPSIFFAIIFFFWFCFVLCILCVFFCADDEEVNLQVAALIQNGVLQKRFCAFPASISRGNSKEMQTFPRFLKNNYPPLWNLSFFFWAPF